MSARGHICVLLVQMSPSIRLSPTTSPRILCKSEENEHTYIFLRQQISEEIYNVPVDARGYAKAFMTNTILLISECDMRLHTHTVIRKSLAFAPGP